MGGITSAWFHDPDVAARFVRRAFAKSMGLDDADLARPIIGIAQTQSDLNNCNNNFRELAEYVKRGVWQAGGTPLEFPTISLGELFMRPTTMLYRNLMAMDTEEMIRAHPLDGVVLLGNCDKTTPPANGLMGCERGHPGHYGDRRSDAERALRGRTSAPAPTAAASGPSIAPARSTRTPWPSRRNAHRSDGTCTVMGTASTMASIAEVLGMSGPGGAAIPAPDARRLRLAEAAGRQIVATVQAGIRPSDVLTPRAFENAIRLMMALGGSTNAVIHLTAIAGRRGIQLPLDLFDRISRETPFITNLRPSGTFHMEQLFDAGGVPAVMKELARGGLLHLDERSITGRTIGEQLESVPPLGTDAATEPAGADLSGSCFRWSSRWVRKAALPSCAATWPRTERW